MRFLDQAKIFVRSGDGGSGCISFRRERHVPFGGPDGGAGGDGGDVLIRVSSQLNTLIDYRYRQHFKARRGENGKGKNRSGQKGPAVIITVPAGTQIWDQDKKRLIKDFTEESAEDFKLLEGGEGGLGNEHFKSSKNQAPRIAQEGLPGQEMWIWLQLKLIADVGFIGLPNAGKSTLLAKLTNAKPRVGDYPFTTLHPNLGTLRTLQNVLTIADIPGLIKDAHKGKGLGHRFLGHVERCKILIHVLDATSKTLVQDFKEIEEEVTLYEKLLGTQEGMLKKKKLLLLNKADLLSPKQKAECLSSFEQRVSRNLIHLISGKKGWGLDSVQAQLEKLFSK